MVLTDAQHQGFRCDKPDASAFQSCFIPARWLTSVATPCLTVSSLIRVRHQARSKPQGGRVAAGAGQLAAGQGAQHGVARGPQVDPGGKATAGAVRVQGAQWVHVRSV